VVDADTLNTFKSRPDEHWLDQDVLYNFHSELTETRGASIRMWCCKRYGQRGIPAPVYSHWIGLDIRLIYHWQNAVDIIRNKKWRPVIPSAILNTVYIYYFVCVFLMFSLLCRVSVYVCLVGLSHVMSWFYILFLAHGQLLVLCRPSLTVQLIVNCYCLWLLIAGAK